MYNQFKWKYNLQVVSPKLLSIKLKYILTHLKKLKSFQNIIFELITYLCDVSRHFDTFGKKSESDIKVSTLRSVYGIVESRNVASNK